MKKNTSYRRKTLVAKFKIIFGVIILNILLIPCFTPFVEEGDNYFAVSLNGINIGNVADTETVDEMVVEARTRIAEQTQELVFVDSQVEMQGTSVLVGKVDDRNVMVDKMEEVLQDNVVETLQRSYTVKIDEYSVNLESSDAVVSLLQAAIDKYDDSGRYYPEVVLDPTRELNALTAQVKDGYEDKEEEFSPFLNAGVESYFVDLFAQVEPARERNFDDFDYGIKNIAMGDKVEIVESYLLPNEIEDTAVAIDEVTVEQEVNVIYEVVAGDTLSEITEKLNIPMDTLIALNENIETETSVIRVGDEITVTEPEPELSVEREELVYYEEFYDAEIVYVDNDDWYTTEQVTLQEPSAGKRNVAVTVSYRNNKEMNRVIEKEEVVVEAVPKIVEKGTQIPPTFIKPISGGRISSYFGYRKAPTKGASTYHGGIDWAVPTGTAVSATSGGVVTKAGWGSGYGYVVYIQHPNGMESRYAHLSKVLVSVGQSVDQGDKIALTGNTGVSTGPHIHFEIRKNGTKVDPLQYF